MLLYHPLLRHLLLMGIWVVPSLWLLWTRQQYLALGICLGQGLSIGEIPRSGIAGSVGLGTFKLWYKYMLRACVCLTCDVIVTLLICTRLDCGREKGHEGTFF